MPQGYPPQRGIVHNASLNCIGEFRGLAFERMNTLADIEAAVEALPPPETKKGLRQASSREEDVM